MLIFISSYSCSEADASDKDFVKECKRDHVRGWSQHLNPKKHDFINFRKKIARLPSHRAVKER
jgi:hypothetical protein